MPSEPQFSREGINVYHNVRVPQIFSGTVATAGVNDLISASGAGKGLVITKLQIQNESSTSILALLLANGKEIGRIDMPNEGDGIDDIYENGWLVGENVNLDLELSAADTVGVVIHYDILPYK